MTLKKQRMRLGKTIRQATGIPFREAIILAKMVVAGCTLENLYSESIQLGSFESFGTTQVSDTKIDALGRVEVAIGPDGCFWDGRIVGPRGVYNG
jgi:hypothetical protein